MKLWSEWLIKRFLITLHRQLNLYSQPESLKRKRNGNAHVDIPASIIVCVKALGVIGRLPLRSYYFPRQLRLVPSYLHRRYCQILFFVLVSL